MGKRPWKKGIWNIYANFWVVNANKYTYQRIRYFIDGLWMYLCLHVYFPYNAHKWIQRIFLCLCVAHLNVSISYWAFNVRKQRWWRIHIFERLGRSCVPICSHNSDIACIRNNAYLKPMSINILFTTSTLRFHHVLCLIMAQKKHTLCFSPPCLFIVNIFDGVALSQRKCTQNLSRNGKMCFYFSFKMSSLSWKSF